MDIAFMIPGGKEFGFVSYFQVDVAATLGRY